MLSLLLNILTVIKRIKNYWTYLKMVSFVVKIPNMKGLEHYFKNLSYKQS